MNVLNLYAGIGGNRKLWKNVNVTAVEYDAETAKVYKDLYPQDNVIVGDAHQYLLEHYKDYDFIWASPPCPTHSDIRRCGVHAGRYEAKYPEMELYQEIILMQHFAPRKTCWVIENVVPYYDCLIKPSIKLDRHLYWCNFFIDNFKVVKDKNESPITHITPNSTVYGLNLKHTNIKDKRKALRNMVNPELGLHILKYAQKHLSIKSYRQQTLFT